MALIQLHASAFWLTRQMTERASWISNVRE
jgi:hypothetical protein